MIVWILRNLKQYNNLTFKVLVDMTYLCCMVVNLLFNQALNITLDREYILNFGGCTQNLVSRYIVCITREMQINI